MYTYTYTYIHTFVYIYMYSIYIYTYSINIYTQVTWLRVKCIRLYTLILTITFKDTFLWENKWFSFSISKYTGRGQGHNNLNCPSKIRLFLGDLNTLKNSSWILVNTLSDLLAIFNFFCSLEDSRFPSHSHNFVRITARSVEVGTRNAELNGNRNPECWGDFNQLVKIEKIIYLGISRYKVELRFWLDLNSKVSRGTNSHWDFCLIWICSCLKSPHHSGFQLPFNSAFRVSSSTERAVWEWLFPFPSHNSLWEVPPLALIESFDPRGSVGPRNVVCCSKSLLFEF